jgi:hypothetical protein
MMIQKGIKMKTYKTARQKKIIGAVYICVSISLAIYAAQIDWKNFYSQCYYCGESNPVLFGNEKTTDQDECCRVGCEIKYVGQNELVTACYGACANWHPPSG